MATGGRSAATAGGAGGSHANGAGGSSASAGLGAGGALAAGANAGEAGAGGEPGSTARGGTGTGGKQPSGEAGEAAGEPGNAAGTNTAGANAAGEGGADQSGGHAPDPSTFPPSQAPSDPSSQPEFRISDQGYFEHASTIAAVFEKLLELTAPSEHGAPFHSALRDYMAALPTIADATLFDSGILAHFRDGLSLSVSFDGFADSAPAVQALEVATRSADVATPADTPPAPPQAEVVASNDAWVIELPNLGDDLQNGANTARANQSGYNVHPVTDGTINDLETIQNAGVLFWTTHANQEELTTADKITADNNGPLQLPASTSEHDASVALENFVNQKQGSEATARIELLEHDGLIGYSIAEYQGSEHVYWEAHYSVTTDFIDQKMSFATPSLVFLNACDTADATAPEGIDPDAISNAFLGDGVSRFIGVSGEAFAPMREIGPDYFFNLVTGANYQANMLPTYTPPTIPFPTDMVLSAMPDQDTFSTGEDEGKSVSGRFAERKSGDDGPGQSIPDLLLEPLLGWVDSVDEQKGVATLVGVFGSKSGSVAFAGSVPQTPGAEDHSGQGLTLDSNWDMNELQVAIPDGQVGNFIVNIGPFRSNSVPLTEWHLAFDTKQSPDQATLDIQFDLYFRGDLRSNRLEPDEDPSDPVQFAGLLNPRLWQAESRSTATFSAQGSAGDVTFGNSGNLPRHFTHEVDPTSQYFTAIATMNEEQFIVAPYGSVTETQVPFDSEQQFALLYNSSIFDPNASELMDAMLIPYTSGFALGSDNGQFALNVPGQFQAKITFSPSLNSTNPTNPATADTPR